MFYGMGINAIDAQKEFEEICNKKRKENQMTEDQNQQHHATPEVPAAELDQLKKIMEMCKDAPGYCCFFGIMDKKRDEKGRNIINYEYKRFQFSYEDTRRTIDEFIKAFRGDISKI